MNDASSPSPVLTADASSPQEGMELLKRMLADPTKALAVEKLREEVFAQLMALVREVAADIPQPETTAPAVGPGVTMSFQELKNFSRQRESAGKQKQEVAQAMVMGALLNRHNEEWNPLDASTDRSSYDSLICALLQAPPPASE